MQSKGMRRLIESVLQCNSDKIPIENNPKIHELIDLLSHSSEEEFRNFLNDFENEMSKFPADKLESSQSVIEYICIQVSEVKASQGSSFKNQCPDITESTQSLQDKLNDLNRTPINLMMTMSSQNNSPEKQGGRHASSQGTRWTVSREDRRKILELMEKAREDQKRRKKLDWCRLERNISEFEEFWGNERMQMNEFDTQKILMNLKNTDEQPEQPAPIIEALKAELFEIIVDFDCIEKLLIRLSRFSSSKSISRCASFILKIADEVYRSDTGLFYTDLKEFDQPFFSYYQKDDDGSSLKAYKFESDDLGRYVRNRSYTDMSRKFYRQRAYRHRIISERGYSEFFEGDTGLLKNLRQDIEYLDANCDDFHFWMKRAISRRATLMISSNPLLQAFSLYLVLSRTIDVAPRDLSQFMWSSAKYGPEWTLNYILTRLHGSSDSTSSIGFLTTQEDSKLANEAKNNNLFFL